MKKLNEDPTNEEHAIAIERIVEPGQARKAARLAIPMTAFMAHALRALARFSEGNALRWAPVPFTWVSAPQATPRRSYAISRHWDCPRRR